MAAFTGQNTDVDASAEVLTASDLPLTYGVQIKAMAANTDKVYVGLSSSVSATTGYQLSAGEFVFLPKAVVANANLVYVIGGAANQAVCFFGV